MIQLTFLVLLIGISHCYGQGIGRTYIEGDGVNGTLTFNFNDATGKTIDVRIEAVDTANPATTVAIVGTVAVTCEVATQDGYTSVGFNTINLNEATKTGSITLSNFQVGRGAEVKCYGVSATGTQFTKEASISSPLVLAITSSPKVSICTTGDIVIKNVFTQQTFPVALSDVVQGSSVTVTCTVAAGGTTAITLNTATVPVGSNSVTVPYSLTSAGTPISVNCSGQSATGSQYTTDTSQGSAVQFTVNRPNLDLYPKQFTTSASAFSLILILTSPPPNASLPVTCNAVNVSTAAEITTGLNNPSCANPNPTDDTDFSLGVGQLEPTAGTLHARVNVTRNLVITSSVTVIVTCCSTDQSLSDAILVVMEPSTNKSIDYSKATVPGSVNTEREYKNPAYVDVSPCPCDITTTLCDIGCCCDQDCTTLLKSTFTSCIPGLPGGQSAALPEYDCRSDHFNKVDWFPMMCVEREFNALLGYFYPNTLAVRNDQAFNEKIATVRTYTYKEEATVTTSSPEYYTSGDEVRTYQAAYRAGEYARSGPVVLPQRILSGECLPESPVEHLKDFTSNCVYELTQTQCSVGSSFNPLFYVESSNTRDPACPKPYVVMKDSTQEVAETNVDYYCATDYSSYVKSTTPQNLVTPNTTYTFNYTLPVSECQDFCGNELSSCTDYNTISDSPQGEVLPPRCTWDDGYTRPPLVAINGNNCDNSVLEVRYKIYWRGSQIVKLDATVIMGNVPLSTVNAPVVITQKFSSDFLHSFPGNPSSTLDNYQGVETTFSRSGKPGYDYEKPLFSGSLMNVAGNNYVNQNNSRQLAVWDTGVDGLCYNAGRKTIMFGQDTFAACMIYLRSSDLSGDCTDLRKLIINRLNFLLAPADKIGRYGNNNPWDLRHWIDIKRENLENLCTRNMINYTSEYLLSLTTTGLCTDMISGISLNIFYAETGKANYYPINEVIGANLTYVNSTFRTKCYTSGGSACGSNDVEPFRLTMSVHFIKSTPNRPARPDKYYAERSTTCQRDICWRNLIYPLSRSYNYENRQYVLGMVLISIIGIVAYMFVTWPWW